MNAACGVYGGRALEWQTSSRSLDCPGRLGNQAGLSRRCLLSYLRFSCGLYHRHGFDIVHHFLAQARTPDVARQQYFERRSEWDGKQRTEQAANEQTPDEN